MTNYDRGKRFEHRVRDDLRKRGYYVIRSAGSKGKIDLVALIDGDVLLIQCKRDGRLPPAERKELLAIAAKYGSGNTYAVLATTAKLNNKLHYEFLLSNPGI